MPLPATLRALPLGLAALGLCDVAQKVDIACDAEGRCTTTPVEAPR